MTRKGFQIKSKNMLYKFDTKDSVLSYDSRSNLDPIDDATSYSRALDKDRKNL